MDEKRVVLLGGGGHASDILMVYEYIAQATGVPHPVIGILDDAPVQPHRFESRGVRHIGSIADIQGVGATHFVIAVGWPRPRRLIWERIRGFSLKPDQAIHPMSFIDSRVPIGEGVVVLAQVSVNAGSSIGAHAYLSHGSLFGHDCHVRDFASVMPGASISGDTEVGEGAMIGANAILLQGLSVGEWATLGAGSVATKSVPADATAVGVPARVVKHSAPLKLAS